MAVKKISQLTEILFGALLGTEYAPLYTADGTRRLSVLGIAKYVLGEIGGAVRTIGGAGTGSIVTTDDEQTLSNKELTNPIINGVALSEDVTGTELNHLVGLDKSVVDTLDGLLADVDAQDVVIASASDNADEALDGFLYGTRTYKDILTASGTSENLSQNDIRTALGIDTAYVIDFMSLQITISDLTLSTNYTLEPPSTATYTAVSQQPAGENLQLDKITFTGIESGKDYSIVVRFELVDKAV